jgi:uncharacterized protein YebE (UPF0316 family)
MLDTLLNPQAWLFALMIFALRVGDMSLDTLRLLFVVRGRKLISWVFGFVQSVIFVVAITSVLNDLKNVLNIIGYAAGFATGNVVGMLIEERLAIGHVLLSIISSRRGAAVVEALRTAGFAVTEIPARGRDGVVTLLNVNVLRKQAERVRQLVNTADPEAFITADDIRPVRRGFWRA